MLSQGAFNPSVLKFSNSMDWHILTWCEFFFFHCTRSWNKLMVDERHLLDWRASWELIFVSFANWQHPIKLWREMVLVGKVFVHVLGAEKLDFLPGLLQKQSGKTWWYFKRREKWGMLRNYDWRRKAKRGAVVVAPLSHLHSRHLQGWTLDPAVFLHLSALGGCSGLNSLDSNLYPAVY